MHMVLFCFVLLTSSVFFFLFNKYGSGYTSETQELSWTSLSLMALEVVITTNSRVTNDEKVGIMMTLSLQRQNIPWFCFALLWLYYQFLVEPCYLFTPIFQGFFISPGAIVWYRSTLISLFHHVTEWCMFTHQYIPNRWVSARKT